MREILFRGKTVDTNEWTQGALVRALGYLDEDEKFFIIPEDALYYNHGEFDIVKEVRRETVGQYTGLTDKDGKKIFEGDIIEVDGEEFPFLIEYDAQDAIWIAINRYEILSFHDNITGYNCTIIGNLYDNPNLLPE